MLQTFLRTLPVAARAQIKATGAPGLRAINIRTLYTGSPNHRAQTIDGPAPGIPVEWTNVDPYSAFQVNGHRGFLPSEDPLVRLPPRFAVLEDLLVRMPLRQDDGAPGLLAHGELGPAVHRELPNYDVTNEEDPHVLMALFRDYTFLASAYLLEPCHHQFVRTGDYGLGRTLLPRVIAQPLETVAAKIGAKPFMEYAQSYALYNYRLKDPDAGITYPNLALVRKFSGCPAEHGFILVHVAIVSHSARLVEQALAALRAVGQRDRTAFNRALTIYRDTLGAINEVMSSMWTRSKSEDYVSFRTFIMGTKNQPMFPDGIHFEGAPAETNPRRYRGESGANDSIIPTSDNLFQLTARMPENPLTQTLRDFRSYRPRNHHAFVSHVEQEATRAQVREFAMQDPVSTALYVENVDWIRAFRHQHWQMTKEYIIRHTTHPVATGGSPIVTWLPNQLEAVLNVINETTAKLRVADLPVDHRQRIEDIMARADTQYRVLGREVKELQLRFPNVEAARPQPTA
ncbi:hypothetical protein IWQ60_000160 [Tieghemiomyces parasiticus]|uniref:Uncharacterized protein n=1 Tax=Tieghemiomyces parasiticus TaxID=78921 RepID=A0A9W8DXU0_9FUNG|nr:hypothetical protein IWQ60_000160 [Tieghemiomyces parasiticus]